MIRLVRISILVAILAVFVWTGCTDRGTNVPDRLNIGQIGGPWIGEHIMDTSLQFQIRNATSQLFMHAYAPKIAFDDLHSGTPGQPMPVVVLLTPSGADQRFYANHGLIEIANQDLPVKAHRYWRFAPFSPR